MGAACAACGAPSSTLIEIPDLPLTGLFSPREPAACERMAHDLDWVFCAGCGHGQLGSTLPAQTLYGEQYRFRTAASATASRGARHFHDWIVSALARRHFGTVVEFGCNDASLLELFAGEADCRVGIDPVLAQLDEAPAGVELRAALVEEVELAALGANGPDLVICQHTLEHIVEPAALIERLLGACRADTVFAFELPCLDALLDHGRFDQIFHEHAHYFSVRSLSRLLTRLGLEVIDFGFDFSHWGAVLVAFRRGPGGDRGLAAAFPSIEAARVLAGWRDFRAQAGVVRNLLASPLPGPRLGYGAALMLPVLDHHFGLVAGGLRQVLDDDLLRQGLWYRNLPVQVRSPEGVDLSCATVVLTAPDNRRPILRRLAAMSPYRIVSPLLAM